MIILFYSIQCNYCIQLLDYINKHKFSCNIQLIDIENDNIPPQIKVVPTIIDTNINKPLEGKKAFDYIYNLKFFNYSTNNITNWKNKQIPKPLVNQDKKALDPLMKSNYRNFNEIKLNNINKNITEKKSISNIKLEELIKLRRKQNLSFNKK